MTDTNPIAPAQALRQGAAEQVPQVRPFRLGVISKLAHFAYVRGVVRRLDDWLADHSDDVPERFVSDFHAFSDAVDEEARWIPASDDRRWTEDVSAADDECDRLLSHLNKLVGAYVTDPDPQRAEAARRLHDRIRSDRLSPRDYHVAEASRLRAWTFTVMEDDTLRADAELLDITGLIHRLREAARHLTVLISQRNDYRATRPAGAHQAARQATDRLYRWLVRALNACATYRWLADGDLSRYADLIRALNGDIHYYQATVLPDRSHKPKPDAADTSTDRADTENTADDDAADR